MSTLRTIIQSERPILLFALREMVDRLESTSIVGEATSPDECFQMASHTRTDLLVLTLKQNIQKGTDLAERFDAIGEDTQIVVIGPPGRHQNIRVAISCGVDGYLTESDTIETIKDAIKRVGREEAVWFSRRATRPPQRGHAKPEEKYQMLTQREQEVIELIGKAITNREIASTLHIAESTLKNHITRIYNKLGFERRAEAVAWMWRSGLMQDNHRS